MIVRSGGAGYPAYAEPPEVDPLAAERLRQAAWVAVRGAGDPVALAGPFVALFPGVEWETGTNDNGVPMRRLVARGGWEVDPSRVPDPEARQAV